MPFTLPNILSLLRLPLALVFVLSSTPAFQAATVLVAGATDFFDGWLARRYQQRTRAGELIDPITDKLFTLTVLLTLYLRQQLQAWEVLLLLSRDLYNTAAFILAMVRGWDLPFRARMSGKIVTVLQIMTVLAYVLLPDLARAMLVITFGTAVYSMVDYTRSGLIALRGAERQG